MINLLKGGQHHPTRWFEKKKCENPRFPVASCNRAASRCKFIPNVHWAGCTAAAGLLVVAQEVHTSEDCIRKERAMISSYLHRRRWNRRRGKNANEGNELAAVDGA